MCSSGFPIAGNAITIPNQKSKCLPQSLCGPAVQASCKSLLTLQKTPDGLPRLWSGSINSFLLEIHSKLLNVTSHCLSVSPSLATSSQHSVLQPHWISLNPCCLATCETSSLSGLFCTHRSLCLQYLPRTLLFCRLKHPNHQFSDRMPVLESLPWPHLPCKLGLMHLSLASVTLHQSNCHTSLLLFTSF